MGRRLAVRRAVNAFCTSLRRRVWSGGSALSMCENIAAPGPSVSPVCRPNRWTAWFFDSRGSASRALACACPVTTQPSIAPGPG